ncbi:MAG: GDP-L-fucose synthase, partial [Patescibacteria group bacterium]
MIDLTKKKILVTGSSGLLGHFILEKLLERGVPQGNIFAPRSKEYDLRLWEDCTRAVRHAH